MGGGGGPRRRSPADPGQGEVEELLKAAQDDLLLRLSVNGHTTSSSRFASGVSSTSLDPELAGRFEALKLSPAPAARGLSIATSGRSGGGAAPGGVGSGAEETKGGGRKGDEDEMSRILGDDLASRFAALKGSISSHLPADGVDRPRDRFPVKDDEGDSGESDDGEGGSVSEKEVEKLMQWAMDAVRLDLVSNTKSEEDNTRTKEEEEEEEEEEDDEESDQEEVAKRENEKRKRNRPDAKKPPTRKWFIF